LLTDLTMTTHPSKRAGMVAQTLMAPSQLRMSMVP